MLAAQMLHDDATSGTLLAAPILMGLGLLPPGTLDTDAVLGRVGLSRAALAEQGARIPASLEHRLWQAIEEEAGDCAIGVRLGANYVHDGLPSLEGYLSRNSPTLRATLLTLDRVARVTDDRLRLPLSEQGELATVRLLREGAPDRAPGFVECVFAAMIVFTQRYVGQIEPTSIQLRRKRPQTTSAYRAAYGVEPRFGAPISAITFPRAALDLPIRGAEPPLATILEAHATQLIAAVPREDPFVRRVRAMVAHELNAGGAELERICERLALSERTLRRRLQARSTSYKDLLDEVRRDLGCQLLSEGEPTATVAERLGFHGPRALQKAFIRWTKLTPAQYRRTLRSGPSASESEPN